MNINQIEKLRTPFYNAFTQHWTKLLYGKINLYVSALNDSVSIQTMETIPVDYRDVRELFLKTWILTGRFFAKNTIHEFRKSVSCPIHSKAVEDDFFDKYIYDFAENVAGQRIVSITQTNKEAILKIIRAGLLEAEREGMGAIEMGRYIKEKLKNEMIHISNYFAERISRTEIVGASNKGQLLGAQSLGYNMTKTWLPAFDSRTRTFEKGPFNHAINETVGIYDDFQDTGEPMQHPGDPKGSAGNVINCRCSQTFKVL